MRKLKVSPPSAALVISLIALTVALTGTAYAVHFINGNLIKPHTIGPRKIKNRSLTGLQIDTSKLGTVPSAIRAVHTYWAVVTNPGGKVPAKAVRVSDPGISAVQAGTGTVVVTFPANVSACANVAVKNSASTATPATGFAQTNGDPGKSNAIVVRTHDEHGAAVVGDFHLLVVCP